MNTLKSVIVSAAVAASTLGMVAVSTSAHAQTCGAWRCGYNGVRLNGLEPSTLEQNNPTREDMSTQDRALVGARKGDPVAVTLPSGKTLPLE